MIVGIDIGGTKTHFRAYVNDSEIYRDFVVPTRNWRVRHWDNDALALLRQVEELVDGNTVESMVLGAHGCDSTEDCLSFQNAIMEKVSFPVRVYNDAELLPATRGIWNGIGLVAGTGSIAVTRDRDGAMLVTGGWGWIIGDEGSASGLVREAGRAARRYMETSNSLSDPLIPYLCRAFDIPNLTHIGHAISKMQDAAELGSYAPVVFDAAKRGSHLAKDVIKRGANALIDLVFNLKKRGASGTEVVAGGGVIVSQPMLAEAFFKGIAERFGGTIIAQLVSGPPVEGACRLAKRMKDHTGKNTIEHDRIY